MSGFSFDLTGRTALVTGASSGIGARFGRILAASGANVVLAARRVDRLQRLQDEIRASGGQATSVALDVASEESTKAAYDAAEAAFGTVDTVIANAGTNIERPSLEISSAEFDEVFAVNLRGVFLTLREGAARMIAAGSRERRNGRIVVISSITAFDVTPGAAPYSASKAGVLQLARVLAREWANRGINVNSILPGYIETELNSEWFQTDGGKRQIGSFPRRRLVDQDGLDALVLYLSSDASRYVTGSGFTVDDGQSL